MPPADPTARDLAESNHSGLAAAESVADHSAGDRFPEHATVDVPPFTRQVEGDEAVVGRPETGVFVALPVEALEILDALAAGQTIAQARDAFAARHGEVPDMGDLLEHLAAQGLVRPPGEAAPLEEHVADQFSWIPLGFARAVTSWPALGVVAATVLAAVVAVADQPDLLPGWRAAYFPRDTALMLFALMLLGLGTTFFHELGHVLAARARGVATRFSIGNRLWFVVWETDMTGIWALPRRQRYLPILAGPLVDLWSAALLVLFGWGAHSGLFTASPRMLQIARALLLVYLMRLLWQAYLFVRTDYYYAFTNALGCKSLLDDTEAFLADRWRRLRGRPSDGGDPLDHLPLREQRAVRGYSWIWLAGRGVALGVLVFIQLPLFFNYMRLVYGRWTGTIETPAGSGGVTTWLPVALFVTFFAAGMFLWVRSMLRGDDRRASATPAPSPGPASPS